MENFSTANQLSVNLLQSDDSVSLRFIFLLNVGLNTIATYSTFGRSGLDCKRFLLVFIEKPSFLAAPQNRNATIGDTIVFEYRLTGRPHPEIQWTNRGKPILPGWFPLLCSVKLFHALLRAALIFTLYPHFKTSLNSSIQCMPRSLQIAIHSGIRIVVFTFYSLKL